MVVHAVAAEQVEEHRAPLKRFWIERFFTSAYCRLDAAIDGASDFTNAVAASGAHVAYVTGRHAAMGPGSVDCLRAHGLPVPDGERVHLLLKPDFATSDDAWKLEAFARLDTLGTLVAAFDNEPAHINGYATHYPGARAVRLATDDSGRPIALLPGVRSIADFVR